jgi:hypothetical protein
MSIYARDDSSEQQMFKKDFHDKVYDGFRRMIKAEYSFYTLTVPGDIEEFVKTNFYYLNGRVRLHHKFEGKLIMALEGETIDEGIAGETFTLRQFLESKHAKIESFEL